MSLLQKTLHAGEELLLNDKPHSVSIKIEAAEFGKVRLKIVTDREVRVVTMGDKKIWVGTPA